MPISSPMPMSAHAVVSGSSAAVARRPRACAARSPSLVALDDARVVQAQHLGRDELGLAHDAVQRRVLGGEAEEPREPGALGLQARRRTLPSPPTSSAAHGG